MGIMTAEVVFDARAPGLSQIAAAVEGLTGLAVVLTESGADVKANLFDEHGYLDFACARGSSLEVFTYRPGAVKELCGQIFGDARLPIARSVTGLNEPPGTQPVYLRGYIGQEPTLFFATQLTLKALGGRPNHPIPEDVRQECGRPITAAELEGRRRQHKKGLWPAVLVGIPLLAVAIPVCVASFFLTLPWRLWKAQRALGSLVVRRRGSAERPVP